MYLKSCRKISQIADLEECRGNSNVSKYRIAERLKLYLSTRLKNAEKAQIY
jgi:hypothetical protein